MEHDNEPGTSASPITAELMRAYSRLGNRGPAPWWIAQTRSWPGMVAAETGAQVNCAVLTLLSVALWHRDHLRELTNFFTPFYKAGWCNAAFVRALDFDPDGKKVLPWSTGDGRIQPAGPLLGYLNQRMRAWRQADPDCQANSRQAPAPPMPAVSLQEWLTRLLEFYGDGHADPRPRQHRNSDWAIQAYQRNNNNRPTSLERLQRAEQRRADLDRDFARLGVRPPSPPVDPTDDLALLFVPEVWDATIPLFRAQRPGRHHADRLREAMRSARIVNRAATHELLSRVTVEELAERAAGITRADGSSVDAGTVRRLLARVW
ncbi:hypothetical protein [Crossiella sp. NPDC003009]